MFDRLAWRRECYERYLLLLDDEEDELDDRGAAVTAEVMTSITPRTGAVALGQRTASA